MKLEMTEGCICWSYAADGKEFVDMTLDEQRELIKTLVDLTNDPGVLQDYYRDFMHTYGDLERDTEPCECCGDTVETYTYESPS